MPHPETRHVRRTVHVVFLCQDTVAPDIEKLLRGTAELTSVSDVLAVSLPKEEAHAVTEEELRLLLRLPSDRWTPFSEALEAGDSVGADGIESLLTRGLLVSDASAGPLAELRRRDERLRDVGWQRFAALYHVMSTWRDVDLELSVPSVSEGFDEHVDRFGPPPDHFFRPATSPRSLDLPVPPPGDADRGLYAALTARKTTRAFDGEGSLSLHELSAVLYYAFGCHGYLRLHPGVTVLRKTSPSGGGLHPTEVYPLLIRVDGIDPGLYHYSVEQHGLELLTALTEAEAVELAREFTAGQGYLARAHALFVLAARFERNFWKYRDHDKAYAVVLMDAGHLSQTFYLVCADLGLGAFVTAAVNNANIEERLGLDGREQGVLAICGCGRPAPDPGPPFAPYVPRKTGL